MHLLADLNNSEDGCGNAGVAKRENRPQSLFLLFGLTFLSVHEPFAFLFIRTRVMFRLVNGPKSASAIRIATGHW